MPLLIVVLFKLFQILWKGLQNKEFRAMMSLVLIILGAGTIFYMRMEGWSFMDAFYFSVITLTTIGYGDISPQTDAGKLFTIFYIFIGLGTFVGFLDMIASRAVLGVQNGQSLLMDIGFNIRGKTAAPAETGSVE